VRVSLDGDIATPTGPQGSHVLTSMLGADGLARVAAGEGELPAGSTVEVEAHWAHQWTLREGKATREPAAIPIPTLNERGSGVLLHLTSLPGPHGSGLFNKVLGGWELTNVTILQSGPPFSAICTASFAPVLNGSTVVGNTGCDYNADGNNLDYPNTPTFGNTLTGLSRSGYIQGIFNCNGSVNCSSIFPTPALGQEGNLGRNTFHGPGYANTDFSVIKNTRIPWFLGNEGANLQFRAEFFNLFNRVNLTNVNNQINGAAFGKSTSTYPARDIQFALRLAF